MELILGSLFLLVPVLVALVGALKAASAWDELHNDPYKQPRTWEPTNEWAERVHNDEFHHQSLRPQQPEPQRSSANHQPRRERQEPSYTYAAGNTCSRWSPLEGLHGADIDAMKDFLWATGGPGCNESCTQFWQRMEREYPEWVRQWRNRNEPKSWGRPDPDLKREAQERARKVKQEADERERRTRAEREQREAQSRRKQEARKQERRQEAPQADRKTVDADFKAFMAEAKAAGWKKDKIIREGAMRFHPDKHGGSPEYTRAMQQVVAFAKGW